MSTRRNPYRDPAIREGLNNLAGLFAPPSGQELAGFATANARRAEAERISDLFARAGNANMTPEQMTALDQQMAVQSGGWQNSRWRLGMDDARSGSNNAADNRRALQQTQLQQSGETERAMLQPVAQGATRFVPEGIAQRFGTAPTQTGVVELRPDERSVLPDGRVLDGRQSAPTMDQAKAAEFQGMSPEMRRAITFGTTPIEAVSVNGRPTNVTRPEAVGQQPVVDQGRVVTMSDANGLPIIQNPDGSFRYPDGRPVPPDMRVTNVPTPQGTNRDLGLGTPGNITERNRVLSNVANADSLLNMYEKLLRENPGSIGIVGAIRGTAQNLIASGADMARSFGNSVPQIQAAQNELRANLQSVTGRDMFDPSIPEAEFIQSTLAYALARAENGGTDISNSDFVNALDRVRGGGMLANSQSGLAAIGAARRSLDAARVRANTLAEPGGPAPIGAAARPAPGAPAAPQGRMRFDANGNMIQ